MKEKLIIIGIGTTAYNIFKVVQKYEIHDVIGFAVDEAYRKTDTFCGLPVYGIDQIPALFDLNTIKVFVAVQWNKLNKDRRDIYNKLKDRNFQFTNIIAPSAIIHAGCRIGDNCWIADNVVLEVDSVIANNTFVKVGAVITHFVRIESHCFISASSVIAANAIVGEQSFIGVNATILNGVRIGKKCIVGASSVVKQDIPDYTVIKPKIEHDIIQYREDEIEMKLLAFYRK
ncbi:MAG: acetyltransferase [Bacteroidota bacterium]|nr:acetyltransferase [Bacteroidota bacterium]